MLANERPLLLRMFRSVVQRSVMANPRGARIRNDPASLPLLILTLGLSASYR